MKKVFFLLAIAAFGTFSLQAQTGQGSMIVGGTAGFNSQKAGNYKATTVSLFPSVRYFVIDRLAVGANLEIAATKNGDVTSSTLGIGPNVRYYFTADRPLAFFGQAEFSVARSRYYFNTTEKSTSTGFGLGIGGNYFLNDHVALEAVLGFDSEKRKNASDRNNNFGLRLGVVAFLWGGGGK